MTWNADDPQGNEAAKIKYEVVRYTRGRGLDLGCGNCKLYSHFIGVDNGHHFGTDGADVVLDCEKLDLFASEALDFVFSSHLLEHITDYKAALQEWWRVLKPGGHLVVYLPHKKFYPNLGQSGSNPHHKHDFLPSDITDAMSKVSSDWDLLVNEERDQDQEYSFLQVYEKGGHGHKQSFKTPEPEKKCAIVRYGGFGDVLQASHVLPELKAQGYHITFYTLPVGHNILKTNPYIDDFFIQDRDQVNNDDLSEFWAVQAKHYDKFIQLSESVEASLLAAPARAEYKLTQKKLHRKMNQSYVGKTCRLAGVVRKAEKVFYPTEEESEWAKQYIKNLRCVNVILWALSGSSVHKSYPYTDNVIARILLELPGTKVVFVGDGLCQLLESPWEAEKRVVPECGKLSIRKTLALAQKVDLVIGPETGVLNCVAFEDVPKILMLSHSSSVNLGGAWKHTDVMTPKGVDCYPCHKLHFGWSTCNRDEATGGAACAAGISPYKVFNNIKRRLAA